MRVRFWSWRRTGKGVAGEVQPHTPPALEQLEPRILLNADLIGLDPLASLAAPQNDQAIYVDLNQQEQESSQDSSPELKVDLGESSPRTSGKADGVDSLMAGLDLDRFSEALLSGALNLGGEAGPVEGDSQAESALPQAPFETVEEGANVEIQAVPCDAAAALLQDDEAQSGLAGGQDVVLSSELPSVEIRGPPADSCEALSSLTEITYKDDSQSCALAEGESVSASNGAIAPDLRGLKLVDQDISNWQGQIIYLDFDGEQDVVYNGPVVIGAFDVPAFGAPGELAGSEAEIMGAVTAGLNDLFAGTGVLFTLDQPQEVGTYSTVYIGGDGSWASEHGSFLGLAEQADIGNLDRADNAFVFTGRLASSAGCVTIYAGTLGDLIAHEAGHLLGYQHTEGDISTTIQHVAAIAADADRTFVHPAEDNQTKNLALVAGTYTFRIDADPNGSHKYQWYDTYSGSSNSVEEGSLYYYDDHDFTFSAGNAYWVRAEVYDANWNWEAAYRWNVTCPQPNRSPTAPSNIQAPSGDITSSSAKVTWTASTDADGDTITYEVQYGKDWSWDGWTSAGTTQNTYLTISNLLADKTYDVRVYARDGKGGENYTDKDKAFTTKKLIGSLQDFSVNEIDEDGDGFASKLEFVVTVNGGSAGFSNGYIKIMEDDWFFDDPITRIEPVTLAAGETRIFSKTVAVAGVPKLWGDGIETWWPYRATQFEFVAKLYDGSDMIDSAKVNKDTHLEILDGEYTEHIQTLADYVKNNRFNEYFDQFGGKPVLTPTSKDVTASVFL